MSRKNYNSLNGQQKFQLCTFLKENHEELKRATHNEAAEIASRALGFVVSGSNVDGALKSVGIKLRTRVPSEQKQDGHSILAQHILEICKRCNIPFTDDLVALAA